MIFELSLESETWRRMTGTDTPNPAGRRAGDEPGIDRVTDAGPADPAPDLAEILKKAEAEVTDLRDAWLRAKAETDRKVREAAATGIIWAGMAGALVVIIAVALVFRVNVVRIWPQAAKNDQNSLKA